MFRDPRSLAVPFTEPEPVPRPVPDQLFQRRQDAEVWRGKQVGRALKLFGTPSLALLLMGGCTVAVGGGGPVAAGLIGLAALVGLPGLLLVLVSGRRKRVASRAVQEAQHFHADEHERAHVGWLRRRAEHQRAQAAWVARADEWGSAQARVARRLDVFGGGLWGWEALLTVHGASSLAGQPVLVVDLSGERVCVELAALAHSAGVAVHSEVLPAQLAESCLCDGLDAGQLVDAIVESMHAPEGAPGASRADRSMDHRILSALAAALGGEVTMARLAEGVRVLLDEAPALTRLSAGEHQRIAHDLFSEEYRRQVRPALTRIESFLHPLEALGAGRTRSGPAPLTCVVVEGSGRGPGLELLTDLIVQWLTHRISTPTGHVPAVIVAGADELARRHLERLSDVCERRGVPLTLLFRHLREASLEMIGGGAVAFMRLGNHEEATRAADFIGRRHTFVLSTLTRTLGGNETHTTTDSSGHSDTDGTSTSLNDSYNFTDRLFNRFTYSGLSASAGASRSVTRNWSSALSFADGTNWSDAAARQRVYEYAVEPTTLQGLPDYALLLAEHVFGQGVQVTPVDCNPAIITLPRVSIDPLPDAAEAVQAGEPQTTGGERGGRQLQRRGE
ncbi:hypothetical protein [Nonomuraea sp. NPDC046570]|uniref:hypothetical protein n=1 Tax=Nonomuraea sp. NPDC046570 TaxID=3155255 RepID=UPI0033D0493D